VHNHTYFFHECTPTAVIHVGVFVIRELKDDMRFSADEEKSFELKTCGSASQTGKHM
jgi:hypothetical protein